MEKAQHKVEARNFDIRKNILKYDDVMNDQRRVVFEQRREMMGSESLEEMVDEMRVGVIDDLVTHHLPHDAYPEAWDITGLNEAVTTALNVSLPLADWQKEEGISDEAMRERLQKAADEAYAQRVATNGADVMRYVEKQIVLQVLDHLWREHLVTLDHLRQVIHLRAIAQRDPLNEYKSEAFELFNQLIAELRGKTTADLNRVEIAFDQEPAQTPPFQAAQFEPMAGNHDELQQLISRLGDANDVLPHDGATAMDGQGDTQTLALDGDDPSTWGRVGRNAPCPCGSGKKYKHCHGTLSA